MPAKVLGAYATTRLRATRLCAEWNRRAPVGARVRYWTGVREGPGRIGVTRSVSWVACEDCPVVLIEGVSEWIALSHVEVIE